MQEAISTYVKSGDTLFISGAQHGEPSAAVHEIVRQKIGHLTVACALVETVGWMLGEGLLDTLLTGWYIQNEKRSYPMAKANAHGTVIREYSHFGIGMALLAGQIGIPYMPTRAMMGSDIPKYNDNIVKTSCPFTGEPIGAVKAIVPDTGIIHVPRCDEEGNAQKWGTLGLDVEGINASRKVIVTTEEIVDSSVIRSDPNRTIIPGFRVDAIVVQPFGAYPQHLNGCYRDDIGPYRGEKARKESSETYGEKLIYGVKVWDEYMKVREGMKGAGYFEKLKITDPVRSDAVITGDREVLR
jgi:glutaconate CoA-transferase subunit A